MYHLVLNYENDFHHFLGLFHYFHFRLVSTSLTFATQTCTLIISATTLAILIKLSFPNTSTFCATSIEHPSSPSSRAPSLLHCEPYLKSYFSTFASELKTSLAAPLNNTQRESNPVRDTNWCRVLSDTYLPLLQFAIFNSN